MQTRSLKLKFVTWGPGGPIVRLVECHRLSFRSAYLLKKILHWKIIEVLKLFQTETLILLQSSVKPRICLWRNWFYFIKVMWK